MSVCIMDCLMHLKFRGLCSGGFFFCTCHRGFLRGSTMIGTASVKLLPLETKCTLHDAFDVSLQEQTDGLLGSLFFFLLILF